MIIMFAADDTFVTIRHRPSLDYSNHWMSANRLKLKIVNTELIWVGTSTLSVPEMQVSSLCSSVQTSYILPS